MFTKFIEKITLNQELNVNLILDALEFAKEAHKNQSRQSGQEYIIHPVAVASIVVDCLNDTASVIAALLHDVVEDTEINHKIIEKKFGKEVASLVEGMTKLNKINFRTETQAKTENFRKFIISISNDIRILVIKLADRLHNMQTIQFISDPNKQKRIILETLEIYVPLAERIGIAQIKDELEDLSFNALHGDVRDIIVSRLENYKSSLDIDLNSIEDQIRKLLAKNYDLNDIVITSRVKRPFSIWKKMRKNNIDFEDITDLVALRILVNNEEDCYKALGVIHRNYKSFFASFRDYISVPKDNGYKSLHTCILFKPGLKIEVQVRTKDMHEIAEGGFAAHWNYKTKVKSYDMKEYLWLSNILEIINSPFLASDEKYEYSRLEMFDNEIFVFTPKGELISLPKDSTVLDFAYTIHTDIGNTCIGAKINGEFAKVYKKLENGSTIKIITDPNAEPDLNYLSMVKTGYARSAIRRYWRHKKEEKIEVLIKDLLGYAFNKENIEFNENILHNILRNYKMSALEFYDNLVKGIITTDSIIKELYPDHNLIRKDHSALFDLSNISHITDNCIIELATCCCPVAGDEVVGIFSNLQGITVHRENCEMIISNKNEALKTITMQWAENINPNTLFLAKLSLEMVSKPGGLFEVSEVTYTNNINVLEIISYPVNYDINIVNISFEISNLKTLQQIIKELENKSNVKEVSRYFKDNLNKA
ncbi:RelA/SpoT family protein [Rickettsiales bacterium LUAb2]